MNENINTAIMQEAMEYIVEGRVEVIDYLFSDFEKSQVRMVLFDSKESIFVYFEENGNVSFDDIKDIKVDDVIKIKGMCSFIEEEPVLFVKELLSISHPLPEKENHPQHHIELNLHTLNSQTACFSSFSDYAKKAVERQMDAIAITDIGSTQSYYDAYKVSKETNLKVLYGLETEFIDEDRNIIVPIVVYAKNKKGLKYIYQLVTMQKTHISFGSDGSIINKALLSKMKDGLILAFSPNNTDLTTYLSNDLDNEKMMSRLDFYDFVELAPLSTYLHFTRPSLVNEFIEPQKKYQELVELIYHNKKILTIVSNAHYVSSKQKEFSDVFDFGADNPSYTFKSTDELYEELSFIKDKKLLDDTIINNPKAIADKLEILSPFDEERHHANDKDAMSKIEEKAYEAAKVIYGDILPEEIQQRLDAELDYIEANHLAPYFDFASHLKDSSQDDRGYQILNGVLSSSFVAYLLSLNDINPLFPNYFCEHCQSLESISDCVFSLMADDKECDLCQKNFKKEGFLSHSDILFSIKEPVFDFEVSIEKDAANMDKLKEIATEKENSCYKRSKNLGIQKDEANERIVQYYQHENLGQVKKSDLRRLNFGLIGTHDTDDEIESDVMIVPSPIDMNHLSPMEYTPSTHFPWMMAHMDYASFEKNFMCFSIHSSQRIYDLKEMNEKAKLTCLDLNQKVMDEYKNIFAFLNEKDAYLGLPYLDSTVLSPLYEENLTLDFVTLVNLVCLSLKPKDEAKSLVDAISKNKEMLNSIPYTYEDVYELLSKKNIDNTIILELLSDIRFGFVSTFNGYLKYHKFLCDASLSKDQINAILHSSSMLDRGEAIEKAMLVLYYAYYKIHQPGLFYSIILEKYVSCYDPESMLLGIDELEKNLDIYKTYINDIHYYPDSLINGMKITRECLKRGYRFIDTDMEQSHFKYDEEKKEITLMKQVYLSNIHDYFHLEEKGEETC